MGSQHYTEHSVSVKGPRHQPNAGRRRLHVTKASNLPPPCIHFLCQNSHLYQEGDTTVLLDKKEWILIKSLGVRRKWAGQASTAFQYSTTSTLLCICLSMKLLVFLKYQWGNGKGPAALLNPVTLLLACPVCTGEVWVCPAQRGPWCCDAGERFSPVGEEPAPRQTGEPRAGAQGEEAGSEGRHTLLGLGAFPGSRSPSFLGSLFRCFYGA